MLLYSAPVHPRSLVISRPSGPEQSNDIDSGNAEHVNNISGLNAKKGTRKPQLMAVSKTFNKTFSNKLQPNEDPSHFGFELHATRVAQRDGPSDGHRGGGRNGGRGKFNRGGRGNPGSRGNRRGPRTANRGGRGLSNHGAQGAVSKNRTSLDPSVNIGCAELLSYTAYGEYPRVKAFQNSAAFVSAAFGGSGIQFNGTRFAPVNESYQ